jgi:hypothetical protein
MKFLRNGKPFSLRSVVVWPEIWYKFLIHLCLGLNGLCPTWSGIAEERESGNLGLWNASPSTWITSYDPSGRNNMSSTRLVGNYGWTLFAWQIRCCGTIPSLLIHGKHHSPSGSCKPHFTHLSSASRLAKTAYVLDMPAFWSGRPLPSTSAGQVAGLEKRPRSRHKRARRSYG